MSAKYNHMYHLPSCTFRFFPIPIDIALLVLLDFFPISIEIALLALLDFFPISIEMVLSALLDFWCLFR